MKKILVLLSLLTFSLNINAQNYTISSYIGDEADYWSGGYVYDFINPSNNLSSWKYWPSM